MIITLSSGCVKIMMLIQGRIKRTTMYYVQLLQDFSSYVDPGTTI